MTEFIEKVNAIMGQKNMDDKKANQLCHLYAMIFKNGYNACVEETAVWLKAMLWKNPKTRQEELVQVARKEYPEWEEAQCHFIDGAHHADSHPNWISVEDELPPCNVFVLTCDEQENENLLMLGGNGRWYDKAVGFHRNITHWMPLPPPPHHIIDANKKVDRVIGTADHIKTALDVLNKKGGAQ